MSLINWDYQVTIAIVSLLVNGIFVSLARFLNLLTRFIRSVHVAGVLTSHSAQRAPRPAPGLAPSARACAPPTAGRALTHAHTQHTLLLRYGRRTPTVGGVPLCAVQCLVCGMTRLWWFVQVVMWRKEQVVWKNEKLIWNNKKTILKELLCRIGENRKTDFWMFQFFSKSYRLTIILIQRYSFFTVKYEMVTFVM